MTGEMTSSGSAKRQLLNKAIYRTRMMMTDGGELIILAPGVERFGEDDENDALIRKYGYCGREKVLSELEKPENEDLSLYYDFAAWIMR